MKNKNKISFLFFGLCVLAWLFILPKFCWGEEHLIINEIQVGSGAHEFIELYNPTDKNIDLSGFKLTKKASTGTESTLLTTSNFIGTILTKSYFLITSSEYKDVIHANIAYPASYSISNNNTLLLYNKDNIVIDKVGFGKAKDPEGSLAPDIDDEKSIGRKNFIDTDDNSRDFYVFTTPTPGEKNEEKIIPTEPIPDPIPEPPKKEMGCQNWQKDDVIISEFLPAPNIKIDPKNPSEFIELYNQGANEKNISGWKIKDEATDLKNAFSFSGIIRGNEYLVLKKETGGFSFSLNNTGEEIISLYNEKGDEVSRACYYGSTTGKSYVYDGLSWKKSLENTPNFKNKFNSPPTGKSAKDKNIYVGMYADFEAKGSDADNDALKYTWDFGDGHKSYLAKTRHKYEEAGKYTITLKISDGSEDKIETYEIEVEKYPKLKVSIIEIMPNPKGIDTGNEYIILENKEKKNINLNGWSIATGSKNLTNHPLTQDLEIKKNKTLKLTQEFSKFSLVNTKGKVELRYPNGEVASKVKYDKGKKGALEDEIYTKVNKKWTWKSTTILQDTTKLQNDTKIQNITEQDSANNTEADLIPETAPEVVPETILPEENSAPEEGIVLSAEIKRNIKIPVLDKKIKYKFINYASTINPPVNFLTEKNYPLLELENKYYFASLLPEKKHYFVSFWENLETKFNLFLN